MFKKITLIAVVASLAYLTDAVEVGRRNKKQKDADETEEAALEPQEETVPDNATAEQPVEETEETEEAEEATEEEEVVEDEPEETPAPVATPTKKSESGAFSMIATATAMSAILLL